LGVDPRREVVVAAGVCRGGHGPARRPRRLIVENRERVILFGGVLEATEDAAVLASAAAHSKAVAGKLEECSDCGGLSTGGGCRKDAVDAGFTGVHPFVHEIMRNAWWGTARRTKVLRRIVWMDWLWWCRWWAVRHVAWRRP
jgi:hypothetical protein